MVRRYKSADSSFPDYKLDLWSRPSVFSHAVMDDLKPTPPASHRSTRLSQELALHVLLTNFKDWMAIASAQDHPVAGIRISKRRGYYKKPSRVGAGVWVSHGALIWGLSWLESQDLVMLAQKGYNYENAGAKVSLYKPTAKLTGLFLSKLFDGTLLPGLVRLANSRPALELPEKSLDRVLCRGVEIPAAKGMRTFLNSLNRTNLKHTWSVEGLSLQGLVLYFEDFGRIEDNGRLTIDLNALVYERIFSSNNLEDGGRFYSKLENLRSVCRPFLRIDGEALVELDYGAHHVRIAYALANAPQPLGDPYALTEDEDENKRLRPLIKAVMLTIFNLSADQKDSLSNVVSLDSLRRRQSQTDANTFRQAVGLPVLEHSADDLKTWTKAEVLQVVEALDEKHAPIKDYFFSGIGLKLQRADSDIAQLVGQAFIDHNAPVFMLHDGFLCRQSDKPVLGAAMYEAFKTITGHELPKDSVKEKTAGG